MFGGRGEGVKGGQKVIVKMWHEFIIFTDALKCGQGCEGTCFSDLNTYRTITTTHGLDRDVLLTLNSSKKARGAFCPRLALQCELPPLHWWHSCLYQGSVKPLSFRRISSLELWFCRDHRDFFFFSFCNSFYRDIVKTSEGLLRWRVFGWQ